MGSYTVSRSTRVSAQPATVHALIEDLRAWQQWSPWEDLDPALDRTYTGPERGDGAAYAWQGNRKAGAGTMRVVRSQPPTLVEVAVGFVKPFPSSSTSTFTLLPQDGGTQVTWSMTGEQNRLMSLVGRVWSMDRMMGGDFERGLTRLKAAAEQG